MKYFSSLLVLTMVMGLTISASAVIMTQEGIKDFTE